VPLNSRRSCQPSGAGEEVCESGAVQAVSAFCVPALFFYSRSLSFPPPCSYAATIWVLHYLFSHRYIPPYPWSYRDFINAIPPPLAAVHLPGDLALFSMRSLPIGTAGLCLYCLRSLPSSDLTRVPSPTPSHIPRFDAFFVSSPSPMALCH